MKRIGLFAAVLIVAYLAGSCGPDTDADGSADPDSAHAAAGEQMPAPGESASPLTRSEWRLTMVSDSAVAEGDNVPTLEFLDDSQVAGHTGCNSAGGPYEIDGPTLTIGPLVTTQMACLDDTVMWVETSYLRAMDATRSYRIEGDTLVLLDEAGAELARFVR
jgi:heat shock protein HslJ